jgi:hypothetical protein
MRVVGDDDLKAVCDRYPMSDTPPACYGYIDAAGCALLPRRSSRAVAWWLLACGVLALLGGRRRAAGVP